MQTLGSKNTIISALVGMFFSGFSQAALFEASSSQDLSSVDNKPHISLLTEVNGNNVLDAIGYDTKSNELLVFSGNSNGSFQSPTRIAVGSHPTSIAVGDLNSDTNTDIVVANGNDNSISVFLGTGTGSFSANGTVSVGSYPSAIRLSQINSSSDSNLDIVVSNRDSNSVSVLLGQGNGSFLTPTTVSIEDASATGPLPVGIAVGDFNNDGFQDVATANSGQDYISYVLGNGDGTFNSLQTAWVGGKQYGIESSDLNKNGRDDLITSIQKDGVNNIGVLLSRNQADIFPAYDSYYVSSKPGQIQLADYNGNGYIDIWNGHQGEGGVSLLLNKGYGKFNNAELYETNFIVDSIAVGDINGDDFPDALLMGIGGTLSTHINSRDFIVISSDNPYPNNIDNTKSYTFPENVDAIDIFFSAYSNLGTGDTLTVTSNGGDVDVLDETTDFKVTNIVRVKGNSVTFRLQSDGTNTAHGYSIILVKRSPDTDGDGIADFLDDDDDNDGLLDSIEDANGNGVVDTGETNPRLADTDGDGLDDAYEINVTGTNPTEWDDDGDGIPDGLDANPTVVDSIGSYPDVLAKWSPIRTGVTWLLKNQNPSGSWGTPETEVITTSLVLNILKKNNIKSDQYAKGLAWLINSPDYNNDFLSRKINTLTNAKYDVSKLANKLLSQRITRTIPFTSGSGSKVMFTFDGWGTHNKYDIGFAETGYAMWALFNASYNDPSITVPNIINVYNLIRSYQNPDGGWGMSFNRDSDIQSTASIMIPLALQAYFFQNETYNTNIKNAVDWILSQRNTETAMYGGYGFGVNGISTIQDTSIAIEALQVALEANAALVAAGRTALLTSTEITNIQNTQYYSTTYLLSQIRSDGNWRGNAFLTAQALNGLSYVTWAWDSDGDGIADKDDTDKDGDGVPDATDAFVLDRYESVDTDGDGIGNNKDTDDDGDGVADVNDAFALNATESVDTDGDGIGDNADTDDDGDGVLDSVEDINKNGVVDAGETSFLLVDTDGDGFNDDVELALEGSDPTNPNITPNSDYDGDGFTPTQGDWNDDDDTLYPGAPEICGDGIDQDGNGSDLACTVPVIDPVTDQNVNEGASISIALNAVDAGGENLTYSINTVPSFISLTDNGNGTASINASPDYTDAGTYAITVTVVDDGNPVQSANISFNLNVIDTNRAPVATDDSATTLRDTLVSIDVLSNDSDIDGDSLTIESATTPTNGSVSIIGGNSIEYTPNLNFTGTDTFNYTINDGKGLTDIGVVSIVVNDSTTNTQTSFKYTALNPNLVNGAVNVVSLSDNNTIQANSTVLVLDKYESGVIPAGVLTQGTTVTGTGAFDIGSSIDGTDMLASSRFTGNQFVIPHVRYEHTYYLVSPDSDANVQINVNGTITPLSLLQGQVTAFDAGYDDLGSAIITSDVPILVSHAADNSYTYIHDAMAVPPAALEVWGVRTNASAYLAALEDTTTVNIYADDGTSETVILNAGQRHTINAVGVGGAQGAGSVLKIVSDKPIGAVQNADSDGQEQTAFMRTGDLGTRFGIPTDAQYIVIGCSVPGTTVVLFNNLRQITETQICTGTEGSPNKAYFGSSTSGANIAAGSYLETSSPVYVMYEDSVTEDEHNLLGTSSSHQFIALNPELENGPVNVISLADNNRISAGTTVLHLDKYESGVIPTGVLTQGTTVTGTAAFDIGGSINGTDMLASKRFAGTQFVIPQVRYDHTYYLVSPDSDASVQINVNGSITPLSLSQGQVMELAAGYDDIGSTIITSDVPILVSHVARFGTYSETHDVMPVPPAALEVWGVRTNASAYVSAAEDTTTVNIFADDGSSQTIVLNAGQRHTISTVGVGGAQGAGSILKIVSDKPIGAVQNADGDGQEQTAFMRTGDLGTRFGIPTDAQYIVVGCPVAGTTVTLFNNLGQEVDKQTCTGIATSPNKAYFGSSTSGANIVAGSYLETSSPVYVMYEDSTTEDEHNLLGTIASHQYFALNPNLVNGAINVVSLSDNNTIQAGSTILVLDKYESSVIPAGVLTQGTSVTGTGAFDIGGSIDGTDILASSRFAGNQFVIPHVRYQHTYYLVSPDSDASVQINVNGSITSLSLLQGQVTLFDAGYDDLGSAIITSDVPILVSHVADNGLSYSHDAMTVPPAALEVWGVRTNASAYLAALEDTTTVNIYADDGTSETVILNAGQRHTINAVGVGGAQGAGSVLKIVSDKPIGAVQNADSDGQEQTAFMRTGDLGTRFGIPTDAQYIVVGCPLAGTSVTLFNNLGQEVDTQACIGTATSPNKAYFGSSTSGANIVSGSYLETSSPVYIMYEDSVTEDEHNLLGTAWSPSISSSEKKVVVAATSTSVEAGGSLEIVWFNISSPTPADWVGVFEIGAPNIEFKDWSYTDGASNGSLILPLNQNNYVDGETYEVRIFGNNSYTPLDIGTQFVYNPPMPSVTLVSPTTVIGSTITVSWSDIQNPTAYDWIGVYEVGAGQLEFLNYVYTGGLASGETTILLNHGSLVVGNTYELRLSANDGYVVLDVSDPFVLE